MKLLPLLALLLITACGGGEDDAPQTLQPPERGVCATTVPIPPDCNLAKK